MAVKENFEHGAEALRSVMAPELSREVPRGRGGDEVACGLGTGVFCCWSVAKLSILQLLVDIDTSQLYSEIHSHT